MSARVLIAGIGNIFMGDDAFGIEVVKELQQHMLPAGVKISDFGVRSYDLAFALTDTYEAILLVDAVSRGEPPGTVYLLELDINQVPQRGSATPDGHSLNPLSVLQLAQTLGGVTARLFLVGCEPAVLDADRFGLSTTVQAAIPGAIYMIEELVSEVLHASRGHLNALHRGRVGVADLKGESA